MKSHQPIFSYSASRRSRHEVTICQTFEPKNRRSSWERSRSPPRKRPRSSSATRTSVIVRGERAMRSIGMPPGAVQLTARRVDQVVDDRSGGPVWDPAHGVGDVAVEAGEEAEAVFAGQVAAAVLARPGHREAPGLAAWDGKQLVDLDVEAALDQFMGGAEAGDAAAEDDDFGCHGSGGYDVNCLLIRGSVCRFRDYVFGRPADRRQSFALPFGPSANRLCLLRIVRLRRALHSPTEAASSFGRVPNALPAGNRALLRSSAALPWQLD